MTGEAGEGPVGPYEPRSGSFRALVYSEFANGFSHVSSIEAGQDMFRELASQLGFEVTIPDPPASFRFTAESLESYEVVVFLNTAGTPLDAEEEGAFEQWITARHGAFVGTHSAADTEAGWAFYKELTGQYHNGHHICCAEAPIVWRPDALDFPAVRGLPSPWIRREEWFLFNEFSVWSLKPGFEVLGTVEVQGVTQPVSFVREHGNFRSFYTSLGHEASTFTDAAFKKHVGAGLLWAVRREHFVD
jgi:type 1 glutamine amidotransferase